MKDIFTDLGGQTKRIKRILVQYIRKLVETGTYHILLMNLNTVHSC